MDRLADIIRAEPRWHIREIDKVLLEEDWGDGCFPAHRDLRTVGDLIRVGPAALAIRFREIDPMIWEWLFEQLGVQK